MVRARSACSGRTLSRMGRTWSTTPADAAPYRIMAATAAASRTRYGREYSSRRKNAFTRSLSLLRARGEAEPGRSEAQPRQTSAPRSAAVAVRPRRVPAPCIGNDDVELRTLGRPAQVLANALRRCVEHRRIARPPGSRASVHVTTGHALHGIDDLPHRRWPLGAHVVARRGAVLFQPRKRADMRIGQVEHVNVVTQTGAVWRRIVLPENVERGAARGGLESAGNDVDLRRNGLRRAHLPDRRPRR